MTSAYKPSCFHIFLYAGTCFLQFCLISNPNALAVQEPTGVAQLPSIDEIKRAWLERQNAVTSIDLYWEGEEYRSARFANLMGPAPSDDFTASTKGHFLLDANEGVRVDLTDFVWSQEEGAFVERLAHQVWNPSGQKRVEPLTRSLGFPYARVSRTGPAPGEYMVLQPLVMCFRILDEKLQFFKAESTISVEPGPDLNGRRCLRVIQKSQAGNGMFTRTIFVDTEFDYLPVRCEVRRADELVSSSELVDVKQHSPVIYVPLGWKTVRRYGANDQPLWTDSIKVTEYRINEGINRQAFSLETPVGAWVNDYEAEKSYIQINENEKRDVLPGELKDDNYSQLLTTKTGELLGIEPSRRGWLFVLLNLTFLAIILALLLYRRITGRG